LKKTNAVRILDRLGISYRLLEYDYDEDDLSAAGAARQLGVPAEQIFKTLVMRGDKTGVIVASVPGDGELDLKALAVLSRNKKLALLSLRELQQVTGYPRGAVSPLGMKSSFPYYLDQEALQCEEIIISAGSRGVQVSLAATDLVFATAAVIGKLCR
jgi:Cys-tRNA(Pro)/Cys-tRNA(Cys) deacylase